MPANCHARIDAPAAGDVLMLSNAPAQISNQLRRLDGVRLGLEDMHEEQDLKATSVVCLASHPLFRFEGGTMPPQSSTIPQNRQSGSPLAPQSLPWLLAAVHALCSSCALAEATPRGCLTAAAVHAHC